MMVIRPVERGDLAGLMQLAGKTGGGLTSLPADEKTLSARIERALQTWQGTLPKSEQGYVFVLEDTDTPTSRPLIHTLSILSPDATSLPEGALDRAAPGVTHLKGDFATGYSGPRPIPGHGTHHYGFMLFAVDVDIDTTSWRTALESIEGHVLARGRVVGTYERA